MASAPGSNVVHFLFCGASKSGSRYANKRSVLRLWQQTWPTMTRIPVAFRAELDYVLDRRGRSSPATVCWNNRSGGCPIARLSIRIGEGATVQESEQTGKKARPDRARRRSCLVPLDQPPSRAYGFTASTSTGPQCQPAALAGRLHEHAIQERSWNMDPPRLEDCQRPGIRRRVFTGTISTTRKFLVPRFHCSKWRPYIFQFQVPMREGGGIFPWRLRLLGSIFDRKKEHHQSPQLGRNVSRFPHVVKTRRPAYRI